MLTHAAVVQKARQPARQRRFTGTPLFMQQDCTNTSTSTSMRSTHSRFGSALSGESPRVRWAYAQPSPTHTVQYIRRKDAAALDAAQQREGACCCQAISLPLACTAAGPGPIQQLNDMSCVAATQAHCVLSLDPPSHRSRVSQLWPCSPLTLAAHDLRLTRALTEATHTTTKHVRGRTAVPPCAPVPRSVLAKQVPTQTLSHSSPVW